jgi:hypothetical protein
LDRTVELHGAVYVAPEGIKVSEWATLAIDAAGSDEEAARFISEIAQAFADEGIE